MPSPPARRARAAGFVAMAFIASGALVALLLVDSAWAHTPQTHSATASVSARVDRPSHHAGTTTTSIPSTTTSTTVPPATSTTTTTSPPPAVQAAAAPPPPTTTTTTAPPVETPAVQPSPAVPPRGEATVWGCSAALAYLSAYAYPGFTLECPGNAQGQQGMTCIDEPGICPGEHLIAIADACPQAYMNEASNSWVLMGQSDAPIDPYGSC